MIRTHRPILRRAFTLTELMISIALALLLIYGINKVFTSTSATLSAGQAVAAANRNEQSLRTILTEDMRALVLPEDAPFLLIRSRREAGFIDREDMENDANYDPSVGDEDTVDARIRSFDWNNDGTEDDIPAAILTKRNHRVDTLRFFARGQFARQTGTNALIDPLVAQEAMIWYGHLRKPDPGNVYRGLGIDYEGNKRGRTFPADPAEPLTAETNPLNFYVNDWTLGRAVVLLAHAEDLNSDGDKDTIVNESGPTGQAFITRYEPITDFTTLSPLSINSLSTESSTSGPRIQFSRYDVAGTTIPEYRWSLAHTIAEMDRVNPSNPPRWWDQDYFDYRFDLDPRVVRPLQSDSAARKVPALFNGCSQFIVEFAGDFLTQSSTGQVVSAEPDGIIDFIVPRAASGERTIRWYGMPRDVDGDNVIVGLPRADRQNNVNDLQDVVPVTVVLQAAGVTVPSNSDRWFENLDDTTPQAPDVATIWGPNVTYIAAWDPSTARWGKPRYIRIIVGTVPATSGGEERLAEFVFSVN